LDIPNLHIMMKKNFSRFLLATALLATPFLALNATAAVGDIYETNGTAVLNFHTFGGTPGTFAIGFSNPKGLAFDGNGHLYVADAGKNQIVVFTVPDGAGSLFLSDLNAPTGVALDRAGFLYVSEAGTGDILKFDTTDKTKTTFADNTGASAGLTFDKSGNLYSADFNGGKIYNFSPDGATKTVFASGLNFPAGLAIDDSGNVFEADSGSGTIYKFAPDGTKTSFVTGLGRPYGLAFDFTGGLIVADNDRGATVRYAPDGTKGVIFQSSFNTPVFVAVEPAQHHLLNISTRGYVQGGNDVLIAGFVVGGNGPVGTRVLVRALGPSLTSFGIVTPLPDPVLELRDSSGALIASNNNWRDSQADAISSTKLNPPDDRESAILTTLNGGAYTAILGSATGAPGTAVVEVYNLP
jgi:sugar lactone lactonase YvrE